MCGFLDSGMHAGASYEAIILKLIEKSLSYDFNCANYLPKQMYFIIYTVMNTLSFIHVYDL